MPADDDEFDEDFPSDDWPDENAEPDEREIEEQRRYLILHQWQFRAAAERVAAALSELPVVWRVLLFGSVANPLEEEVPRFRRFRRWGIALPHECGDIDIAVWLEDFTNLRAVQKAKLRGLNTETPGIGGHPASHQVDMFLHDAATGRYVGRLCQFAQCPKGKPECRRNGCGNPLYLKNDADFKWRPGVLAPERSVELYVRPSPSEGMSQVCR